MTKKILSVLLIFAVCIFLASCERENRLSFPEFTRILNEEFEEITVSAEDAFFDDGEWFLFVSVAGEDDILITAKENAESRFIEAVSVSCLEMGNPGQIEAFIRMCEAAAAAFVFGTDYNALLEGVMLYNENAVFSEDVYFYEEGRFFVSFFNDSTGSTLMIEI